MNDRIEQLLSQAARLEDSATKVALLEDAVREADAQGARDTQYRVRMELIRSATFCGQKEKALVAFTWCLAISDKNPDQYDDYDLLWKYKWVLDHIVAFPQVSREQITRMQEDFFQRLQRKGFSLRPAHYLRWSNQMRMGQLQEARRNFEKWLDAPRDILADCEACERNKHMELLLIERHDVDALAIAQPILEGRMRCAEIPHHTLGTILPALIRLGRLEEAQNYHRRGYRLISKNPEFVGATPDHLAYLLHVDDLTKALTLFRKHIGWAVETTDMDARFRNYLVSAILFERLAADNDNPRQLELPKKLPVYNAAGEYKPSDLAAWFLREAEQLRDRFNQRNGTDYYDVLIADVRQLTQPA